MSRNSPARKSKLKMSLAALAVLAVAGGFLALRNHNKEAVLAAVTTPGARNELRRQHMKLLSAAMTNYVAQVGKFPINVPTQPTGICSGTGAVCKQFRQVDVMFIASRGYLEAIPNDPSGGPGQHTTGYTIVRLPATNEIKIAAPRAENGADISETIRYR